MVALALLGSLLLCLDLRILLLHPASHLVRAPAIFLDSPMQVEWSTTVMRSILGNTDKIVNDISWDESMLSNASELRLLSQATAVG